MSDTTNTTRKTINFQVYLSESAPIEELDNAAAFLLEQTKTAILANPEAAKGKHFLMSLEVNIIGDKVSDTPQEQQNEEESTKD